MNLTFRFKGGAGSGHRGHGGRPGQVGGSTPGAGGGGKTSGRDFDSVVGSLVEGYTAKDSKVVLMKIVLAGRQADKFGVDLSKAVDEAKRQLDAVGERAPRLSEPL